MNYNWPKTPEKESGLALESNQEFLNFQKVEVTAIDETKPWKPATEVRATKNDGTIVEKLDANLPFFTLRDSDGNEITVSAVAAGHIDSLHIKNEDPGSHFECDSLEELLKDMAKKMPPNVAKEQGVSSFSIEMGKNMGKEGIASLEELKADGVLADSDIEKIRSAKQQIFELNKGGDKEAKDKFIDKFNSENTGIKIKLQLVRGDIIIPIVDSPKRQTTKLFAVFGPGADGKKTMYTAAPGRYMPRHPNPGQHKDAKTGVLNEDTFKESSDAWLETVMLTGN